MPPLRSTISISNVPSRRRPGAWPGALGCLLIAAWLAGCASFERLFAPGAEPWPRWEAHEPESRRTVDHSQWDRFLAAYLVPGSDGINRVAYARVSPDDRKALAIYVDRLAATPVDRLSRDEQFAYWVNLYNALTVKTVLDHYPVRRILDVTLSRAPFAVGPWSAKIIEVDGERLSLDDIEHRILRPIWRDPRIHYAVNCAALGCPNLQPRAFTAATRTAMLDAAARAFVNHRRGSRIDDGSLAVSRLYIWYREDFGGSDEGVIAHLRRYAEGPLLGALENAPGLVDGGYDWALNDAR